MIRLVEQGYHLYRSGELVVNLRSSASEIDPDWVFSMGEKIAADPECAESYMKRAEVRFGDGKTYYEHHHDHEHHDHMICTSCGRVIEFFSPDIESLQDEMADKFGFRPTHHSLRMWGVCAECQEMPSEAPAAPPGAQPRVRVKTAIH